MLSCASSSHPNSPTLIRLRGFARQSRSAWLVCLSDCLPFFGFPNSLKPGQFAAIAPLIWLEQEPRIKATSILPARPFQGLALKIPASSFLRARTTKNVRCRDIRGCPRNEEDFEVRERDHLHFLSALDFSFLVEVLLPPELPPNVLTGDKTYLKITLRWRYSQAQNALSDGTTLI